MLGPESDSIKIKTNYATLPLYWWDTCFLFGVHDQSQNWLPVSYRILTKPFRSAPLCRTLSTTPSEFFSLPRILILKTQKASLLFGQNERSRWSKNCRNLIGVWFSPVNHIYIHLRFSYSITHQSRFDIASRPHLNVVTTHSQTLGYGIWYMVVFLLLFFMVYGI